MDGETNVHVTELTTFASAARTRSGQVGDAAGKVEEVSLGFDVLGVFNRPFIGDLVTEHGNVVRGLRSSERVLAEDADAADAVAEEFTENEQKQTDTFKNTDIP